MYWRGAPWRIFFIVVAKRHFPYISDAARPVCVGLLSAEAVARCANRAALTAQQLEWLRLTSALPSASKMLEQIRVGGANR